MMFKCVALQRCLKSQSFIYQTNRLLNHYEALGLNRDATHQQIKQAYKEKSLQLHPDINQNDPTTHDRFIRVQEAYQVLSKERSKDCYDRELEVINIYNIRSMMIETDEERFSRLHMNFQNHFGVKIERADFIKQYSAYEEKKQQSCKTENIVHGWMSYIATSAALLFVVTFAILVNDNRKRHADAQRSMASSHMDERKQMFMKQLNDKEQKEMALFLTKFRSHRINKRKEQIEFERWKYEENYRKQRDRSIRKSKTNM